MVNVEVINVIAALWIPPGGLSLEGEEAVRSGGEGWGGEGRVGVESIKSL